ncbi:MAG TPA: Clp protease N-terminal domain-containing protein [Pilimelia sp.]|nr:Clp protease N-terminal domain-containing protein [Pilimelia sp.]
MFERFTDAARAVVNGAPVEAQRLQHPLTGTEHLLLALLRHGEGAGALLRAAGVTSEGVEAAIGRLLHVGREVLDEEDAAALRAIGVDLDEVRARIEQDFGPGSLAPPPEPPRRWFGLRRRGAARPAGVIDHLPYSPRAKKVLELALRESLRLKHGYVGAEHVLLGLLRENAGLGASVLADAGVDVERLRRRTEVALRAAA